MDLNITHDLRGRRFYTIIDNKEYSLEYNEVADDLWEFHCNYIPKDNTDISEEKIIREMLIEFALYYMARNSIKVLESGSCIQVKDFLDRKKDLDYLVKYIV